jgi:hypothetical protein
MKIKKQRGRNESKEMKTNGRRKESKRNKVGMKRK